uniref:Uncharacterized protein n=1 Tax=Arundo donax TaxID=35708 RepID=A0A0A9GAB8_ARUDO
MFTSRCVGNQRMICGSFSSATLLLDRLGDLKVHLIISMYMAPILKDHTVVLQI